MNARACYTLTLFLALLGTCFFAACSTAHPLTPDAAMAPDAGPPAPIACDDGPTVTPAQACAELEDLLFELNPRCDAPIPCPFGFGTFERTVVRQTELDTCIARLEWARDWGGGAEGCFNFGLATQLCACFEATP